MKTAGIIAEYNPFHKGHKYHIDETRKTADGIIAVMSSNVCQRGEFAYFDKFSRAAAAVRCGVDLVVELPGGFSLSAADTFARGGTEILSFLGADILSFGSETGDTEKLLSAAGENIRENPEIKALLKTGLSYPRALGEYHKGKGRDMGPNDTLALCYMMTGYDFSYNAVKRTGRRHDEMADGEFVSAAYIRENGIDLCKSRIPCEAYDVFKTQPVFDKGKSDMLQLSFLKHMTAGNIKMKNGVAEGIENRIIPALRDAATLEEALAAVKTKRYSMARIKRLFMTLYLDIPDVSDVKIPYIRVLALNKTGEKILHDAKKNCPVPIITSLCDGKKAGTTGSAFSEKEGFITDIYNFCRGIKNGEDERYSPHIL